MHIPLRFAIHLHSLILTIFDIQYFCYITFLISKITTHTNKKKLYYNKCQPSGLAYWCPHIRKLGVVYCRHDNKAFEKHPCHFLDSVSPLLLLLLLLPLPSKKKNTSIEIITSLIPSGSAGIFLNSSSKSLKCFRGLKPAEKKLPELLDVSRTFIHESILHLLAGV